ncbi:MAG: hypothetical protein E7655_09085 [Ruminococcaceae bacterium]|nr:hypothetical protein [Oscillospiraceae bacterium]
MGNGFRVYISSIPSNSRQYSLFLAEASLGNGGRFCFAAAEHRSQGGSGGEFPLVKKAVGESAFVLPSRCVSIAIEADGSGISSDLFSKNKKTASFEKVFEGFKETFFKKFL